MKMIRRWSRWSK